MARVVKLISGCVVMQHATTPKKKKGNKEREEKKERYLSMWHQHRCKKKAYHSKEWKEKSSLLNIVMWWRIANPVGLN